LLRPQQIGIAATAVFIFAPGAQLCCAPGESKHSAAASDTANRAQPRGPRRAQLHEHGGEAALSSDLLSALKKAAVSWLLQTVVWFVTATYADEVSATSELRILETEYYALSDFFSSAFMCFES
jgi:hypothetical protein